MIRDTPVESICWGDAGARRFAAAISVGGSLRAIFSLFSTQFDFEASLGAAVTILAVRMESFSMHVVRLSILVALISLFCLATPRQSIAQCGPAWSLNSP
ncbi:MAG: hypothetical protein KDA33_08815, partial [Phycisphaerales bacterium]|nr:hypothetical protein [Phycisphaerales bacterium]